STLGLTDLVFGNCGTDSTGSAQTFQPSAARRYGEHLERFCVQGAVLDLTGAMSDRRYRIAWRIKDDASNQLAAAETTLVGESAKTFYLRPVVSSLFLGNYQLQVEVQEGKRSWAQNGFFEIEAV